MATTALVISGGGSRAAFAVGVLKYIFSHRPDINFDFFCGTGTSALITPLAALGEILLLEKLFTSNRTADLFNTSTMMQRFPQHNSLYNSTPFTQKITNIFTDARFAALQELNKQVFIAAHCLQSNRTTYFTPGIADGSLHDFEIVSLHDNFTFREAVQAACSIPVFMPPVSVASLPDHVQQFTSAGGIHYDPVKLAIDKGADNIYAILLTPENDEEDNRLFKTILEILEKQMDSSTNSIAANGINSTRLTNDVIAYLNKVRSNLAQAGVPAADIDRCFSDVAHNPFEDKRKINLHVIRPEIPLDADMGGLGFEPMAMQEMLREGERIAEKAFGF